MSCDCAALESKLSQILAVVKAQRKEIQKLEERVQTLENEELTVDITAALKKALGI